MRSQLLPGLALAAVLSAAACFEPVEPSEPGGLDGGRCQAGSTRPCTCEAGGRGAQTCGENGRYGACGCEEPCVPGRSESCVCADGRHGARLCRDEGIFGDCTCTGPAWDGGFEPRPDAGRPPRRDAGSDPPRPDASQPARPDASAPGPDAGTFTTGMVSQGTESLVDFFPFPKGLIVVRKTGIDLLDGTNTLTATVSSPREITAAAFDGTLLGVADKAMLSVYDVSLSVLRTAMLTESCASAVAVSGARFVCGPGNDWDRVFTTYDMSTGVILSTSVPRTYQGIPMRRVPGTDDFVTVTTNLSPSDFHLHRVGPDHKVVFLGESPYHGDFAANMSFAFDGTPAQHLIQMNGIFLKIYAEGCESNSGWGGQGCFIRDGELGTLAGPEMFTTMADDGAGAVFALVSTDWSWEGVCAKGCKAQRIDVAQRMVTGETNVVFANAGLVVDSKWDPYGRRFLVGYLLKDPSSSWGYKGFELQAVAP